MVMYHRILVSVSWWTFVQVLRVKSRLSPTYNPVTGSARGIGSGYRDVLLNLRPNPQLGLGGHIFEVQLHVDAFYAYPQNGGALAMRMYVENELLCLRLRLRMASIRVAHVVVLHDTLVSGPANCK